MDDTLIIQLLQNRDPDGLDQLLRRHGPLLRYVVSPILPDPREAEECLSDISLKIWEGIGGFDPSRGTLSAWLTALARNTALNRARGQKRPDAPLDDTLPHPGAGPEEALLRRERRERLFQAVGRLAPGERALFFRKYYYCQSTAQMAAELGLSQRAVEGRLYRLREKLRREVGGED